VTTTGVGFRAPGGFRLADLDAQVAVGERELRLDRLSATSGTGPLHATGTFRTPRRWWEAWREGELDLRLAGDDVLLYRRTGLTVRGDVSLVASGPLSNATLRGEVDLHSCKLTSRVTLFDVRARGGRPVRQGINLPGLDLGEEVRVGLDVGIDTSEPFVVDNNVFRGDLRAALHLGGTLAEPRLEGGITGARSTITLPGCRLVASHLVVQFSREEPRFPTLALNASGRRHGYDIDLVVRGPINDPEVVLSSIPALPPADLAVLVTTGARPATLSGTRGVSSVLGSYLAEELADYLFGSESTVARERFLDRFTVELGTEISADGNESIVLEFHAGNGFYLQGERDVYEDINMGVVFRVRFK
jgi:autotransporter translocation and assembly factor TamB